MDQRHKTDLLQCLTGMLVLRGIRNVIIHVQGVVVVVMMGHRLRMRHGIGQVGKSLFLTPRHEPHQCLQQNGKNQKSGTGTARHAGDSNDLR